MSSHYKNRVPFLYPGNKLIYINFNNEGAYNDVWVSDKSAQEYFLSLNWADIDGGKLWARYYDANNEITTLATKVAMIYSHQNDLSQAVYKLTIPGEATRIQFCYNKTNSTDFVMSQVTDIPADKNAFYFDDWNNGTPILGFWNYAA